MEMVERLDGVAEESSNGWNNAGTGHSALAELNYTPEDETAKSTSRKPSKSTKRSRFPVSSGLAGSARRAEEPAFVHQHHPAHELCLGR
jgi:L-2-hydroxyglutarate oxidase LhgO